jgi:integrin alpha FG-GAP repeat containing protein 1
LFKDGSNSLLLYDTTATPPIPLPLRIGDVDLDGFPDLIPIVVRNDKGSSHTPEILISRPCTGKDASQGRCPAKYGRTFSAMVNDVDPLATISDARGLALLDLDEDVRI